MAAPRRIGRKLHADDGAPYIVEGPIGQGGHGAVHSSHCIASNGRRLRRVCIKVCKSRQDWHGEAFFGALLSVDDRVG
ncbi:MAG: hypothetical protein FWE71_00220 [Nocardioidaceae bacterium]|nr:hypothetical protein [Nocardioidaceae bacterium]MCL2612787.1 hypothetical protein [Nocardioidaceae bacterium]